MRSFLAIIISLVLITPALAKPPTAEHEQMIYPTVMLTLGAQGGSGTAIYSKKREGEIHSYILTAHHVISSAIELIEEWSSLKNKKIKVERRKPINVHWFQYNKLSRAVGSMVKTANIVAWDKHYDLALLRVRDKERFIKYVARLRHPDKPIYMAETVYIVGAGLGENPFITRGLLSILDREIDGQRFMLATAQIIFGNSGGGLFRRNLSGQYELIGVPVKMAGIIYIPITHMAFSLPMETVWKFLEENCFGFIVDSDVECEKDKDKEEDDDDD